MQHLGWTQWKKNHHEIFHNVSRPSTSSTNRSHSPFGLSKKQERRNKVEGYFFLIVCRFVIILNWSNKRSGLISAFNGSPPPPPSLFLEFSFWGTFVATGVHTLFQFGDVLWWTVKIDHQLLVLKLIIDPSRSVFLNITHLKN